MLNLDGEPVSLPVLRGMTDAIAHRGPDGEGHYTDGPCGLGHKRLAIIDLSDAAQQPMSEASGRYTVCYNGEIYNFRELRVELEELGRTFRSRSDTEVLLQAWSQWGTNCVERLNGMFAFAIWDSQERTLWLARDRYGIKPLYWARSSKSLMFGSEVKAILKHPDISPRMDEVGLMEYMTFQNFFTDRTLFRDVRLMPAGHWMRVGARGAMRLQQYWDWCFTDPEKPASADEYVEELDRLFQQAVSRQLVSDVPVGAYLSGGMDSGSITAVAAKLQPGMCSFTVGFDLRSASGLELATDERADAEYMSYLFGTEHYEMVLKAGDMERALPRMAPYIEEPRVGQSYPNFYASQLAAKFGKVVLSGVGGDELFGGYPWRYYRAVVNDDFDHYALKYYAYWQRLVPDQDFDDLIAPIRPVLRDVSSQGIFRGVFPAHLASPRTPEDYVNHSLYFEAKTFLHGLLVVEDKLSMAHGLELRVPFLDNDLVDFGIRVPVSLKLGNLGEVVRLNENEPGPKTQRYFERTHDGKLLLRRAMAKYVPDSIAEGSKRGFFGPDASWFRGESIEYVKRLLLSPKARIYEYLSAPVVRRLLEDHMSGMVNRRLLIWSLLSIEWWCHTFAS